MCGRSGRSPSATLTGRRAVDRGDHLGQRARRWRPERPLTRVLDVDDVRAARERGPRLVRRDDADEQSHARLASASAPFADGPATVEVDDRHVRRRAHQLAQSTRRRPPPARGRRRSRTPSAPTSSDRPRRRRATRAPRSAAPRSDETRRPAGRRRSRRSGAGSRTAPTPNSSISPCCSPGSSDVNSSRATGGSARRRAPQLAEEALLGVAGQALGSGGPHQQTAPRLRHRYRASAAG